ncbi:MAG: DUF3298 and DUF4163 domain-containing protein [Spirochaetaceae bacterium]|nr:DUF3298 and DUF4163 domain-containing protein [Spirochaetaceae bacterium]
MKRLTQSLILSILVVVVCTACISQKSSVPGVTSIRSLAGNDIAQADMDIPEIAGQPQLNSLISKKINGWYDDFITEAQLNSQMVEEYGQPFTFETQWKVPLNNEECTSVLLTAYQFTGGANGLEQIASFTWNKITQNLIPLESFLPLVLKKPTLEALAAVCREELTSALSAENDTILQQMILEGTEPVAGNYQIFTISEEGLTIYFQKYQVAPGSAGTQAVLIPYLK